MLHAPLADIANRLPRPARVRLRSLPAFGQLPHTLEHVRMSAWLVQHPASPQDLADMIGIDEEAVLRFLGACSVLGLTEIVVEAANVAEPVAAPQAAAEEAVAEEQPAPVVEHAAADDAESTDNAGETPDVAEPPESGSVLERLRAAREQNRARVAAAIRSVSGR